MDVYDFYFFTEPIQFILCTFS